MPHVMKSDAGTPASVLPGCPGGLLVYVLANLMLF